MRLPRLTLAWKTTVTFLVFGLFLSYVGSIAVRGVLGAGFSAGSEWHSASYVACTLAWMLLSAIPFYFLGRNIGRPALAIMAWVRDKRVALPEGTLSRKDELGDLARVLQGMSDEINAEKRELEDRARALAAMNRIDKAVLGSSAGAVLFDEVLGAVMSYVPARTASIMVRDPDGGGFDVIAMREGGQPLGTARTGEEGAIADIASREAVTRGGEAVRGFLPDGAFPEALLVRFTDAFEVPVESFGREVLQRIGLPESGTGQSGLLAVNLPFTVAGHYSGSLILMRPPGGPGLAKLMPLADQVGVALKDLEVRDEGKRNWQAIVRSLVRAVDAKSAWTRGHSERVAGLSTAVGRRLLMDAKELDLLDIAAVLHDVGKIGVPESILDKPSRLEPMELALIQRHPAVGAAIVEDLPAYASVRSAILYHHERWDGSGYPEGLAGEDIPLAARIIALSDVYDAITDDRPYRRGMKEKEARDFIVAGAGSLFDPRLVRLFLETLGELPGRSV